jgi:hypothetical protein
VARRGRKRAVEPLHLPLALIPSSTFDVMSLSVFFVSYGLDWVATAPPTVTLTNKVFGSKSAPVTVAWIFAGHQVGGGIAAVGAGFVRSGLVCLLASLLVPRIARPQPSIAAGE